MRKRLIAIAACLGVGLPIALAGSAYAYVSTSSQHAASATATRTQWNQGGFVTGEEHFEVYANAFEASFAPIYFTGPLTTGGTGYKDFSDATDQAFLPIGNGTFEIYHPGLTQTSGVTTVTDPTTCVITITGSGPVYFTHGTGAFRGISGSGTVTLNIRVFLRKTSSGCSQTDPPWGYIEIANGTLQAKIPVAATTGAAAGIPTDS